MADMGAVDRAVGGGMAPGPEMAPEAGPQGGDGMEMLAQGMQAIQAFISTQAEQGNPAAQQAMQAFQGLVQSMKGMVGGEAPAEQPMAEESPVPLQGQGATVLS